MIPLKKCLPVEFYNVDILTYKGNKVLDHKCSFAGSIHGRNL